MSKMVTPEDKATKATDNLQTHIKQIKKHNTVNTTAPQCLSYTQDAGTT